MLGFASLNPTYKTKWVPMPPHHLHLLPFLAVLAAALAFCAAPSQAAPPDRLSPCPRSPNCVFSQDPDPARRVEPLRFVGPPQAALASLRKVLAGMVGCTVVQDEPPYLRAEFRSRVFGFVDDVEFLLEADAGVIHLRSAARTGWWDLGVNRRRVEEIRTLFGEAQTP